MMIASVIRCVMGYSERGGLADDAEWFNTTYGGGIGMMIASVIRCVRGYIVECVDRVG